MKKQKILIKYYSLKMLLTVDLNTLTEYLFQEFGDSFVLEYKPMNQEEVNSVTNDESGISIVHERFWLFHEGQSGDIERKKSLEELIIEKGQK